MKEELKLIRTEVKTKYGNYLVFENNKVKFLRSLNYNFNFDKTNGYFERWGKTKEEDPPFSPFGPEIWDFEVSTICRGPGAAYGTGIPCSFCYKSSTPNGKNISFDNFKTIFNKIPITCTQIAFGLDAQCESNPDIWKIMDYCRNNNYNYLVPNVTVADINNETAEKLAKHCGAVSVSRYSNKELCYNSVKKLTDYGLKQCNIHAMISNETYEQTIETINDIKYDNRLKNLGSIVYLSLKQKGRGKNYTQLSQEKFDHIIKLSQEYEISYGLDSCSAHKLFSYIDRNTGLDNIKQCIDPCESLCFSFYTGVDGNSYACSFAENENEWKNGINMYKCEDFLDDVWYNNKSIIFRENLIKNNRNCPLYQI